MPRHNKLIWSLLLIAVLAQPAWAGQIAGVGKVAPGFTLNAQYGGSYSLSDYQGKVVLLMMIGYA